MARIVWILTAGIGMLPAYLVLHCRENYTGQLDSEKNFLKETVTDEL